LAIKKTPDPCSCSCSCSRDRASLVNIRLDSIIVWLVRSKRAGSEGKGGKVETESQGDEKGEEVEEKGREREFQFGSTTWIEGSV
jgi:hypothetical protein